MAGGRIITVEKTRIDEAVCASEVEKERQREEVGGEKLKSEIGVSHQA